MILWDLIDAYVIPTTERSLLGEYIDSGVTQGPVIEICTAAEEERQMQLMRLIGHGVIIPFIAAIGMVLNLLSFIVFTRGKLQESTYTYLASLALADSILLSLYLINGIGRGHYARQYGWRAFEAYLFFPLGVITNTVSVMVTVAVSVERYIFIYHISQAKRWCTQKIAREVVLIIWIASIILNGPKYFALKVHEDGTMCYSQFGMSDAFAAMSWFYFIIGSLIPGLALIVLNILLIRGIRQAKKRQESMVKKNDARHQREKLDENRLTKTLIGLVFVYLLGEIPSALVSRNIVVPLFGRENPRILASIGYKASALTATILAVLHSSLNFVVYSVSNNRFWAVFKQETCVCMFARVPTEDSDVTKKTTETP